MASSLLIQKETQVSSMKKWFSFKISLLLASAIPISGCGQVLFKSYIPETPGGKSGTVSALTTDSPKDDPDFNCPQEPNVVPNYDWDLNGTGFFRVCESKKDLMNILIHGKTSRSNVICIFPAEVVNQKSIFTKPDLITGAPLSQCVEATEEGIYAKFEGIKFNAVFIVEKPDQLQMENCLFGGVSPLCPQYYSFGKFR